MTQAAGLDVLWEPLQVGTMALKNRIMVPTHGAGVGNILGSERQAESFRAYYVGRARGGAAWVGGSNCFVLNPLIPGFEPTGVGATTDSNFRNPLFLERYGRYADELHEEGAFGTLQMILMGGMPHGPTGGRQSSWATNVLPHEMEPHEIEQLVEEYGYSAGRALEARLDGLEIHANHDDVVQWFLSPLTNQREDDYGGSVENRLRMLLEINRAIRAAVGNGLTLGVRLCMDEMIDGGYDLEEAREIVRLLTASGDVDYFSFDVGGNWAGPSYIQPLHYEPAEWAPMSGALKAETNLPVVYAGRVTDAEVAAQVLADGYADVVGLNRATIADPQLPNKAREGRLGDVRPCIGINDCIHRGLVDGLPFGCAVNPSANHELEEPHPPAEEPRRILVVGGGPAGLETAAIAAERGHNVTLWEREPVLGGQMAIAANAPRHRPFTQFVAFEERRLAGLGVGVSVGRAASAESVLEFGADAVVLATGATSRRPDVPGVDLPNVVDIRDVLLGSAEVGQRVVVVAQDDHMPPLSVADHLAGQGKEVRVLYQTLQVAPLVGKYTIGGIMSRLVAQGVQFEQMHRLVGIEPGALHTKNIYTNAPTVVEGFDTVVLACGGASENALYRELEGKVADLHILGDAYAPRRITFATRQAWSLARQL